MTLRQLLEDKTMKTAIETMLNDFCDLTGLAAVLNDASGNRLTELSNISSYCKIIRARDNQCCLSDKKGADIAAKVGETCIYICHAGLIDFAIPIIVNGEHIGSIMAGQVRSMRPLSIDFSSRLEDECDAVIEKYEAIPFMTNEQLQKSARVLGIIRQYIIECIEKKSLARQAEKQSTGIVRIDEFADLSSRIAIKMHNLLYMEGKHLLYELLDNYVVPETRQIHLQLFEKIFTEQLTTLKLSIPQRSTLANYSDLLVLRKETNSDYYIKLYDYLFEDIILNKRFREKNELDYAMAYLHRYYYKKLSNNEIASYVNLSPDYFSRLFKRHTGITWQDYLTTKRIRVSKSLLNERSDSILTIALQIGYSDANYFSRVFKKNTGCSPNEYRKSLPK